MGAPSKGSTSSSPTKADDSCTKMPEVKMTGEYFVFEFLLQADHSFQNQNILVLQLANCFQKISITLMCFLTLGSFFSRNFIPDMCVQ